MDLQQVPPSLERIEVWLVLIKWVLTTGMSPSCVVVVSGLSGLPVLRFSQYLGGFCFF